MSQEGDRNLNRNESVGSAQSDHEGAGIPMFARTPNRTDTATVELRGECPRATIDMLDAVSLAEDITRTALVNRILGEWERKERHRASVVNRVLGLNPTVSDAAGGR